MLESTKDYQRRTHKNTTSSRQNDEENRIPGFYSSYPTAPYPSSNYPMPRPAQMTTNTERAVVLRQDDGGNRDIVTIEQHQDHVNRELAELESGRNNGQT